MQPPVKVRIINQALVRPMTVAGCEKAPLGLAVTLGVMFGFCTWMFWSLIAAMASAFCFFVLLPQVRRMGKTDPELVSIYIANWRFASVYPARSAPMPQRRGLFYK